MANRRNAPTPNQPIVPVVPGAPRRPRRRGTNNNNNTTAFETPPPTPRRSPAPNTARPVTARRLRFNEEEFMRFLNELILSTPVPRTPAQKTPKRAKKNNNKK